MYAMLFSAALSPHFVDCSFEAVPSIGHGNYIAPQRVTRNLCNFSQIFMHHSSATCPPPASSLCPRSPFPFPRTAINYYFARTFR